MPIYKDKAVVAADPLFLPHIPADTFSVIKFVNADNYKLVDLFIAVAASGLPEYTEEIRHALNTQQFRILFLREDIDTDWLPEQLLKAKLPVNKLLPKLLLYAEWRVPKRIINAWAEDSQHVLIANAFATRDVLVVRNCALEQVELSFERTPVLRDIPIHERAKFEIDDGGSFIHWAESDIDLDFDGLRYLADPELRKKGDAKKLLTEEGFGYAVAGIRKLHHLTQTDIEQRTGISERQLRRYETAGIKPRVSSLEKLAKAHDLDLNSYLAKLAKAVNGPAAIVIPCNSVTKQSKIAKSFTSNFPRLNGKGNRPLTLVRPKGSKDHDIWSYHHRRKDAQPKEQLALAVRVDSAEDCQTVWSWLQKQRLSRDIVVGLEPWPSTAFVPASLDYVLKKLLQ